MHISTIIGGRNNPLGVTCQVCSKFSTECKLMKCSGCKMVLYCSKEHQKYDWYRHKSFCRAIQKVVKLRKGRTDCESHENRKDCHCTNIDMCEKILDRYLDGEEMRMVEKPYCSVCHRLWDDILSCPNCNFIVYCSEEHRKEDVERHSAVCDELKLTLDINRVLKNAALVSGCINVEDLYQEFPTYDMDLLLSKTKIMVTLDSFEMYGKYLLSDTLSLSSTVLYAMYRCGPLGKMKKKELTIHIVGCSQFEGRHDESWTLMYNFLYRLEILNLIFVGPEIGSHELANPLRSGIVHRDQTSKSTSGTQCQLNQVFSNSLYHDFIKDNSNSVPDVVMIFNCGFHDKREHDSWKESLSSMCRFPKTIIAFTSFTKWEAELDFKCFDYYSGRSDLVYVCSERNPFRSHLPIPETKSDLGVFYNNNFISILYSK